MRRRFILLLVTIVFLSSCGQAGSTARPTSTNPPTPLPNVLYVDPSVNLGGISPLVYGSNYGPWISVPVDMLPDAYDAGITNLRFPGGEWGDSNKLTHFHIDYFMSFVEAMDVEVNFAVNLKEGTPEEAAELVRYVNLEKGYQVKYWTIGNEPTLFSASLGRNYDTEEFNRLWRQFAQAMKAVDPTILMMGPELHQFTADYYYNPKDSTGADWMTAFLEFNGDLVDVVTYHRYPFPKQVTEANVTIADLRADTKEWDQTVIYLRGLIYEITGRDIPIAVTEFNTHYNKAVGGEATPDSFYNAIWLTDVLGRLINQNVLMANHWMLTSSGGYGGWGIIGRGELRPSYYVYEMFKHFGTDLVMAASDDPELTIYASTGQDNTLSILVVNLSDEEKSMPFQIKSQLEEDAVYYLLDQEHLAEEMGMVDLFNGEINFPARSVSLFIVKYK